MNGAACGDRSGVGVVECGGAWVSVQMRSVAAVIAVTGRLDDVNVEAVVGQLCRFVRLDGPLILDVHDLDVAAGETFARLVSTFGVECHWGGVDWILVAADDQLEHLPRDDEHLVVEADSIAEALAHVARVIHARRHLPLFG